MKFVERGKYPYSGIFIDHGLPLARTRDRYRQRRKKLMETLNFPILIFGVDEGPGGANIWPYIEARIYQEPLILYLTGVNQLQVALYLEPNTGREILFLPKRDLKFEFWQGTRLGAGDVSSEKVAKSVTGIEEIHLREKLDARVISCLRRRRSRRLGLYWHEGKRKGGKWEIIRDSNYKQNQKWKTGLKRAGMNPNIVNICDLQFELRLPLDKVDIQSAREANRLTGEAFRDILPKVPSYGSEHELRGDLEGAMLKRAPYGLSYPTIAASGKNAAILHYEKSNDTIKPGELFLIDFGLRWGTMRADVSRTFPVSGRFNPLQRLLYEICYRAQLKVEQRARAGVTIQELDHLCWESIESELKEKFIARGGRMDRAYARNPHGVSHLMGEMEHDGDAFGQYKTKPMQVGWMISNEPGIYGRFRIEMDGVRYDEHLGIRIEDNLIIQKNECLNLSAIIPRKISEIERLIKKGTSKPLSKRRRA